MKFIAILLAFGMSHYVPNPASYRSFSWFDKWIEFFHEKFKIKSKESLFILSIALPVIAFLILFSLLPYHLLVALVINLAVLFYCIGPESIGDALNAGKLKKQLGLRNNSSDKKTINAITDAALHRWFGILFWYVILGLIGAIIYRLAERSMAQNNEMQPIAEKTVKILNFPVAWVMALALAVASDFERVWNKCKPFLNSKNIKELDTAFLHGAMNFAVKNCEIEQQDKEQKNIMEKTTLSVLHRMLLVWLVLISMLFIFAFWA